MLWLILLFKEACHSPPDRTIDELFFPYGFIKHWNYPEVSEFVKACDSMSEASGAWSNWESGNFRWDPHKSLGILSSQSRLDLMRTVGRTAVDTFLTLGVIITTTCLDFQQALEMTLQDPQQHRLSVHHRTTWNLWLPVVAQREQEDDLCCTSAFQIDYICFAALICTHFPPPCPHPAQLRSELGGLCSQMLIRLIVVCLYESHFQWLVDHCSL